MNKTVLVVAASVAMLVVFGVGTWVYKGQRAAEVEALAKETSSTLVPAHAMTLGPADARVTIVEFFDPACETCAAFARPVHDLIGAYPGRVRLVLRYAPFHPGSDEVVKILASGKSVISIMGAWNPKRYEVWPELKE